MKLVELSEADKKTYNDFIAARPSGSFLQSWEWGDWRKALGEKPCRLFLKDGSGRVTAAMQAVQIRLPLGRHYLYIPYGPVTGHEFKTGDFGFVLQQIRYKFPGAIFVRFEPKEAFSFGSPVPGLPMAKSSNIQPAKTLVVDLALSEDEMLAQMHPKTRYNIKLAQKHGCRVCDEFSISNGHGLYIKEAVDLIVQTSRRQGFKSYGAGYYEKLIDFLAIEARGDIKIHLYKALYQNRLLACAVVLDFGGTRTYLFGGSSPEHKNVMAPYLLHFTAMKDAKGLGLKVYDFWGIETSAGETPGFVRFKQGFGGRTVEYAGAYDCVISPLQYRLYQAFRYLYRKIK